MKAIRAMHVLVTGASSFVGSHIARHFLQIGREVIATYRRCDAAVGKFRAEFSESNLRLSELDLARTLLHDAGN
ncbi:MAG: NAD-dependent epimerase/dehydratase family protein [Xanthobacteraceae bacterium]